mgnify:CR=1 FL=1
MDYPQAFEMMKIWLSDEKANMAGIQVGGLSEGQVAADVATSSLCGLSESGVIAVIRLTEDDLKAEDWETVLLKYPPIKRIQDGKSKDYQSQKDKSQIQEILS